MQGPPGSLRGTMAEPVRSNTRTIRAACGHPGI